MSRGVGSARGASSAKLALAAFAMLALACAPGACERANRANGTATGSGGVLGGGAGYGGAAGPAGDDLLAVPPGLPSTNVNGADDGLTLVAFTLAAGPAGAALYAAVRNDGARPACQPGMTIDFFDKTERQVTSAGAVLQCRRLYRLDDGTILPCVAPGEIAMAAATGLPGDLVIDELGSLRHLFPSFTLEGLSATPGLTVDDVRATPAGDETAYTGTVTNRLDVTATSPRVMVLPVNRAGRPLAVATARAPADLGPGDTWSFETDGVADAGADFAAFPAASFSR